MYQVSIIVFTFPALLVARNHILFSCRFFFLNHLLRLPIVRPMLSQNGGPKTTEANANQSFTPQCDHVSVGTITCSKFRFYDDA